MEFVEGAGRKLPEVTVVPILSEVRERKARNCGSAPCVAKGLPVKIAGAAVLVTHSHYDHLDRAAVEQLMTPATAVVCDKTSAEAFDFDCYTMVPGAVAEPLDGIRVEAVAAYNTTEGHLQFHPREREDCGYVLTLGGTRVYIAGDSEPTPEMRSLEGIDIAFLPVNQPYTMTVDQAAEAVRALRPAIFYPYHYGEVEQITDLDRLAREVAGLTEMRVRPME